MSSSAGASTPPRTAPESKSAALMALGPMDGRYGSIVSPLRAYFSEHSLIRERVRIELAYFLHLHRLGLKELQRLPDEWLQAFLACGEHFGVEDSLRVKEIEQTTLHDVKAVEYFLRDKLRSITKQPTSYEGFIHFGLTSQDINNTALPLLLKRAQKETMLPKLHGVVEHLEERAKEWRSMVILAHTHGQPASPTHLGKEIQVFAQRIREQLKLMASVPFAAKFGGATGGFNAHRLSYPEINWKRFADDFVASLGLKRSHPTTQIEHYDHLAALFDGWKRINTILIDLCRDMWSYVSMDYFVLEVVADEVGSSAMPQKVNPIHFENAEGNLGMANALFSFMASKLPVSRLQRDLTDSTVLRNLGIPFAHTLLALEGIHEGMRRVRPNEPAIKRALEGNEKVITEGIQALLKKSGHPEAYEVIKAWARNHDKSLKDVRALVDGLSLSEDVKKKLSKLSAKNYTGYAE